MENIQQQEPLASLITKDRVDLLSALVALSLKASTAFGGMILVLYAANEGFFYDVSSFACRCCLTRCVANVLLADRYWSCLRRGVIDMLHSSGSLAVEPIYEEGSSAPTQAIHCHEYSDSLLGRVVFLHHTTCSVQSDNWKEPRRRRIVAFLFFGGFLINMLLFTKEAESSREIGIGRRFAYLIPILLVFFAMTGSASYLTRRSMILLSFRYEPNSAVVLHEIAYQKVAAIARTAGLPICATLFEKDLWMLQKATVVWHGVGATSYLKLAASEETPQEKSVLIPLPSNELEPIRI